MTLRFGRARSRVLIMALSIDQRSATVRQIMELEAELNRCNGDAPDQGHQRREQLKQQMRSLAMVLWSDPIGHTPE